MVYKTVVIDPPWEPLLGKTWATRFTDKARPQKHYSVMSLSEIIELKPNIEAQAHMYVWVLNQHVDWGYELARAWGFEPLQMLTWVKPGLGTGNFQCNSESILVCRKGSRHGNPFKPTGGTAFNWPRGKHSEKPDAFYGLVEKCSPGPYLDMYARKNRSGWDSFGNEVSSISVVIPQSDAEINHDGLCAAAPDAGDV